MRKVNRKQIFNSLQTGSFLTGKNISFWQLAVLMLVAGVFFVSPQQLTNRPDRGFGGNGGYQTTGIDSVSLQNGSVSMQVPLASLPPIAGGKLSYTLTASYNSKLWNVFQEEVREVQQSPGCPAYYTTEKVQRGESGSGWRIGGQYEIFFRQAKDDYKYLDPDSEPCYGYDFYHMSGTFFKPMLRMPDGSEHELFVSSGYPFNSNWDYYQGIYRDHLKGYLHYKSTTSLPSLNSSMRLHTIDGSYITVIIDAFSVNTFPFYPPNWTIYLKEGTRVVQSSDGQRIKDTNNNSIHFGYNSTGGYFFAKDEQTTNGREIRWSQTTYNGQDATKVEYQTVGGGWQTTWVVWGTTTVKGKLYYKTDWNPQGGEFKTCYRHERLGSALGNGEWGEVFGVIRDIILPATEQGVQAQKYSFAYNSDTTEQVTTYEVRDTCSYTQTETSTRAASKGMGELNQVTTPTGAVIKYNYAWDTKHDFTTGFVTPEYGNENTKEIAKNVVTSKTITHDGITDTWTYDIAIDTGKFVTGGSVENPDGSSHSEAYYPTDIVYGGTSGGGTNGLNGLTYRTNQSDKIVTERKWILLGGATSATGSPSQSVGVNPVVDTEFTSLLDDNGNRVKMTAKKFKYDYNGELLQTIEYDWFDLNQVTYGSYGIPNVPSGTTVLRTVNNSYYNEASLNQAPDPNSTNAYHKRTVGTSTTILGALKETTVGNSITQYSYDGLTYGTAPTKGNLTKVADWDSSRSTWNETSSTYNSYGNVTSTTDPKGNVTQIFYEDNTHAMPTKTIVDPQNGTGQQVATVTYDFYTGLPTSLTDINGNVSSIDYTNHLLGAIDPFGRPGKVTGPWVTVQGANKRQTTKTYYEDSTRKTRVEADLFNEGDALLKSRASRDQLGRVVLTEKNENGANTYSIFSEAVYKINTRTVGNQTIKENVVLTSNPRRSTSSTTDGWTRAISDNLGRTVEVTTFSGTAQPPFYGTNTNSRGSVITVYSADTTTVTDEAGKQRRSVIDALRRLVRIDEPSSSGQLDVNGAPAQPTTYAYDVLNNLTDVTQTGSGTEQCGSTVSTCTQTRTFTYNSLSQLKSAANPESGTIQYEYDANGNLTKKTDARGVVTDYTYDKLNRVLTRSYTAPSGLANYQATHNVSYTYDNKPYAKGMLTKVVTGNTLSPFSVTEYQSFDQLGRVTQSQQTTDGKIIDPMTYTYNLSGLLIEQKYPSGRVVKNVLETDGDLSQVQSKKTASHGFWTYANSFTYTASGAVSSMQLGNGKWESTQFNSRLQPTQIALGTVQNGTDKLKLDYLYGTWENGTLNQQKNNGNVAQQTITVPTTGNAPGFTAVQNYTYDSLNRLKTAMETISGTQSWKETYLYDRFGNKNYDTNSGNTTTLGSCSQPVCNPTVNPNNNRLNGYGYDNAGSIKTDALGRSFTYDAENKQTKVMNGTTVLGEYFYDGDGKRVKKIAGAETTIFVYDASGKMVAEYSNNPEPASTARVSYLTNDHLGSPRITTDKDGKVFSRRDFLPFGEEITKALTPIRDVNLHYGDDLIKKKFTTYERDDESKLDFAQARYYSPKLGRFYSVDPENFGASEYDPQSWNGYAYARNNPTIFTDSDGLDVLYCDVNNQCVSLTDPQANATLFNKKYQAALGNTVKNGRVFDSNGNLIATYVNDSNAFRLAQSVDSNFRRKAPVQGTVMALGIAAGVCVALCGPAAVTAAATTGVVVATPQSVCGTASGGGSTTGGSSSGCNSGWKPPQEHANDVIRETINEAKKANKGFESGRHGEWMKDASRKLAEEAKNAKKRGDLPEYWQKLEQKAIELMRQARQTDHKGGMRPR